jgi:hypothetical protein
MAASSHNAEGAFSCRPSARGAAVAARAAHVNRGARVEGEARVNDRARVRASVHFVDGAWRSPAVAGDHVDAISVRVAAAAAALAAGFVTLAVIRRTAFDARTRARVFVTEWCFAATAKVTAGVVGRFAQNAACAMTHGQTQGQGVVAAIVQRTVFGVGTGHASGVLAACAITTGAGRPWVYRGVHAASRATLVLRAVVVVVAVGVRHALDALVIAAHRSCIGAILGRHALDADGVFVATKTTCFAGETDAQLVAAHVVIARVERALIVVVAVVVLEALDALVDFRLAPRFVVRTVLVFEAL